MGLSAEIHTNLMRSVNKIGEMSAVKIEILWFLVNYSYFSSLA